MSYHFQADRFYRMPTHFSPSLGSGQGLDGRRYVCLDTPRDLTIQATFEAKAASAVGHFCQSSWEELPTPLDPTSWER